MTQWLSANLGTILIALLLFAIAAAIVVKLIRDKKRGRSACGGNCAACAMRGGCHKT